MQLSVVKHLVVVVPVGIAVFGAALLVGASLGSALVVSVAGASGGAVGSWVRTKVR